MPSHHIKHFTDGTNPPSQCTWLLAALFPSHRHSHRTLHRGVGWYTQCSFFLIILPGQSLSIKHFLPYVSPTPFNLSPTPPTEWRHDLTFPSSHTIAVIYGRSTPTPTWPTNYNNHAHLIWTSTHPTFFQSNWLRESNYFAPFSDCLPDVNRIPTCLSLMSTRRKRSCNYLP